MLKKQYLKSRPICKVTFTLSPETGAEAIRILGDFNNWDAQATPMKQLKDGRFTAVVELEQGQEYQFRYLVDQNNWVNEEEADRLVANPFDGQNSVIVV
jgi:1,4-alpha-glucan branching enzyme